LTGARVAGSKSYIDLSASWDFSDRWQVYGGVQNLFNTSPPLLAGQAPGLNTDTATYDAIGRRYFLGATLRY
jgi:outer membrane receptor protein involved in Fe transport